MCGAFVLLFHLRARWWRTDLGRDQMGPPAAIGALCLYTILASLWPDGCAAIVLRGVRTAIILGITVLMTQRIRMILQARREHTDP